MLKQFLNFNYKSIFLTLFTIFVCFLINFNNILTSAPSSTDILLNKTVDSANNIVKLKGYIILPSPHRVDGTGAVLQSDTTTAYFGQALLSGTSGTNSNYIEYRLTIPEDIDTAIDLVLERWKFRLGAADTAAHTYNIGMVSVADSASYDSSTIGQWITLSFAGDASGASGDVETISSTTLTSWKSNLTAGQLFVIRLNRNGSSDASTQNSYSGPLVISYGIVQ